MEKKDEGYTTIRIKDKTKERLNSAGKKGQSYDEIIEKLLKK